MMIRSRFSRRDMVAYEGVAHDIDQGQGKVAIDSKGGFCCWYW